MTQTQTRKRQQPLVVFDKVPATIENTKEFRRHIPRHVTFKSDWQHVAIRSLRGPFSATHYWPSRQFGHHAGETWITIAVQDATAPLSKIANEDPNRPQRTATLAGMRPLTCFSRFEAPTSVLPPSRESPHHVTNLQGSKRRTMLDSTGAPGLPRWIRSAWFDI